MNRLEKALSFATKAHKDQKRKYTGDPYIVHPIAVANMIAKLGFHEDYIIAAYLHDTVEDTDVTFEMIEVEFGIIVAIIVEQLTDVYIHEAFPNIKRQERKLLECYRISKISGPAKSIKVADLIDNSYSIVKHDPGFAITYLKEKEEMLTVLKEAHPILLYDAHSILKDAKKKLNL
jgi:(p)ppGpp synthase/HD superfamily hydrolase